nr:MAG TPA: hypothetical protein [Caudoviricetes sp.]
MRLGIVGVSKNGVIGFNGIIPWQCKEDMNFFRKMTMGFPCIMGRTTYNSLSSPLVGRLNVVVSHCHPSPTLPNVVWVNSLKQALMMFPYSFVIGGSSIYKQAMPYLDGIYVSIVQQVVRGDTFFVLPPKPYRVVSESPQVVIRYYDLT